MLIINGEERPDSVYIGGYDMPDRVIKLEANSTYDSEGDYRREKFSVELNRTEDGGWKFGGTDYTNPENMYAGGSGGILNEHWAEHHPWVLQMALRRIIELEDQLAMAKDIITPRKKQ